MTNIKQQFKLIAVVLSATAIIFLAWGTQKVSAFIQKKAADSESIRITETNSGPTQKTDLESPGFSGCNSLL